MRKYLEQSNVPMIAEGNIDTPEKARRVLELGCFSVVVGSIITRPQLITKRFVDCIGGISMLKKEQLEKLLELLYGFFL